MQTLIVPTYRDHICVHAEVGSMVTGSSAKVSTTIPSSKLMSSDDLPGGRPSSLAFGGCGPMRHKVSGPTLSCCKAGRTSFSLFDS